LAIGGAASQSASEHAFGDDDHVTGLQLDVRLDVAALDQVVEAQRIFLLLAGALVVADEAGLVALSLVVGGASDLSYVVVDESLHQPIRQALAVLKETKNEELAQLNYSYKLNHSIKSLNNDV